MKSRSFAMIALVLAAAAGPARADDKDNSGPPTHDPERSGWTEGLAVGTGDLHLVPSKGNERVVEGAGVSLRLGKVLSNKLLFMGDIEYVTFSGGSSAVFGGGLQLYLTDRIYARIGAGLSRFVQGAGTAGGDDHHILSVGGIAGFGVEFLQLRSLGVGLELILSGAKPSDATFKDVVVINDSLMLSIQWW